MGQIFPEIDDEIFLRREYEASKRKRFHSILNRKAVVYLISIEGANKNFCPSLQGSYYSTVILILGT